MSKRSLASPSTPSRKKSKNIPAQNSLDQYFGASPSTKPADSGSPSKATVIGKGKILVSDAVALPDDASYAWELAKADGLDLETLQKLELESASRHRQTQAREVIDLDAEDSADTGPSSQLKPAKSHGSTASSGGIATTIQAGSTSAVNTATSLPVGMDVYKPLDVDPGHYIPDLSGWSLGAPIPYSFLAHTFVTLSGTRSRIAILNTLTNTLRTIIRQHPASLLPALYLLSNALSPPYSPIELGLGPSIISKAIQHVSGLTSAALKRLYNATGDVGDVAFEAKSNVRTLIPHPPLLAVGVYESLLKIAAVRGQGAAKQRQSVVEKLLVAARGEEIRYLVRTLSQNLRVGAVRTSILTALARAAALDSPPNLTVPVPPNSPYKVSEEALFKARAISSEPSKKKGIGRPSDIFLEVFEKAESLIKKIYVQHPNYDHIVAALLDAGLDGLRDRLPLTLGVPLLPALGSPTRSLDEIYTRLELLPFAAEFKYDGQRAQIHAWKGPNSTFSVKLFSRHLEDMTAKYPDVVALVEDMCRHRANSFIIDAEIVAVDPENGNLRSFQELSNRARKDVKLEDVKVTVCVFAFDIMYLDEQILLDRPFRERRKLLRAHFPPLKPESKGAARFDHVRSCESEDGREAVEAFWQEAVTSSCEGLMIKLLDSGEVLEDSDKGKTRRKPLPATYEPDKRTAAWLKLKKDYVIGLGDSLDLVPIGAWHGNGRKAQWWSPILLAVRDPETGRLVGVCKCMSGFTDAFYKEMRERYPENSSTCSPRPQWDPEIETGGLRPEVYFKPQEVWETRGADITISPVSVAALGLISQTRGLSLRFPRFIRVREDKGIEQASTPAFLAKMYRDQQAAGSSKAGADEGELLDAPQSDEVAEDSDGSLDQD